MFVSLVVLRQLYNFGLRVLKRSELLEFYDDLNHNTVRMSCLAHTHFQLDFGVGVLAIMDHWVFQRDSAAVSSQHALG